MSFTVHNFVRIFAFSIVISTMVYFQNCGSFQSNTVLSSQEEFGDISRFALGEDNIEIAIIHMGPSSDSNRITKNGELKHRHRAIGFLFDASDPNLDTSSTMGFLTTVFPIPFPEEYKLTYEMNYAAADSPFARTACGGSNSPFVEMSFLRDQGLQLGNVVKSFPIFQAECDPSNHSLFTEGTEIRVTSTVKLFKDGVASLTGQDAKTTYGPYNSKIVADFQMATPIKSLNVTKFGETYVQYELGIGPIGVARYTIKNEGSETATGIKALVASPFEVAQGLSTCSDAFTEEGQTLASGAQCDFYVGVNASIEGNFYGLFSINDSNGVVYQDVLNVTVRAANNEELNFSYTANGNPAPNDNFVSVGDVLNYTISHKGLVKIESKVRTSKNQFFDPDNPDLICEDLEVWLDPTMSQNLDKENGGVITVEGTIADFQVGCNYEIILTGYVNTASTLTRSILIKVDSQ